MQIRFGVSFELIQAMRTAKVIRRAVVFMAARSSGRIDLHSTYRVGMGLSTSRYGRRAIGMGRLPAVGIGVMVMIMRIHGALLFLA